MNFVVIVCAVLLNIILGRLFLPYARGIVGIHIAASKYFAKKPYKKSVAWGTVFTFIGIISIWIIIDHMIMLLEYQSKIYGYILYGLTCFFCLGTGQLLGILRKCADNTDNRPFLKQLFEIMLIPELKKLADVSYKKAFTVATARIIAEKIIVPSVIMLFFGAGATVAYAFVNTLAWSDNHIEISAHGFAKSAVTVNRYISWIGYVILSLILWAFKWVFGMRFENKTGKYRERAAMQLFEFSKGNQLTKKYVKHVMRLVYGCTLVVFLMLIAVYIFIVTTLAALGLDEYWDFWNGAGIKRNWL